MKSHSHTAIVGLSIASAGAFLTTSLTGCMVAALAPAVGMATGVMKNSVTVSIDDNTVTPELRSAFASAKTLTVVAGDRTSVKAADALESSGRLQVNIDRPTAKNGEMTGSERREALRKICNGSTGVRPDLALLGRVVKTESNNVAIAALTGRVKTTSDWSVEVLRCSASQVYVMTGKIEFDVGMYNLKPTELEEQAGTELGKKLVASLLASGGEVLPTSQQAVSVKANQTESSAVHREAASPNAPLPVSQSGQTQMESRMLPAHSNQEIQRRLVQLGLLAGKTDGIMGKKTTDAISGATSGAQGLIAGATDDAKAGAKDAQKKAGKQRILNIANILKLNRQSP